jgi:hypothetical protein
VSDSVPLGCSTIRERRGGSTDKERRGRGGKLLQSLIYVAVVSNLHENLHEKLHENCMKFQWGVRRGIYSIYYIRCMGGEPTWTRFCQ